MSALAKTPKYGAWAKGLAKAEKVAEHPFLAKAAQETALWPLWNLVAKRLAMESKKLQVSKGTHLGKEP